VGNHPVPNVPFVYPQPLRIDRNKIAYRIDPAFVHFAEDPLKEHDYDAVLLEVEVCSVTLGTSDRFPVLYMAMENINCFDEVMSKGWFSVDYLCATREGLAMGACGKCAATITPVHR